MRMVTGAILLLAGVIPVTAGTIAQAATWNKNIDTALGGWIIGAPFLLVGVVLLVWGLATEGRRKQDR